MKTLWSLFLISLFCILGCKNPNTKVQQELKKVNVPKFSSDSAYAHIQKQIAFGHRTMNTEAHEHCKDWLIKKLGSYGFEMEAQHFEARAYNDELLKGTNIIGSYKPNVQERVMLCANYDLSLIHI